MDVGEAGAGAAEGNGAGTEPLAGAPGCAEVPGAGKIGVEGCGAACGVTWGVIWGVIWPGAGAEGCAVVACAGEVVAVEGGQVIGAPH